MAEPQQLASSERNTMSIQEKIRIMKLTLDSQDHQLQHPEEDERAEENPTSSQATNQSRVSALSSAESGVVVTPSEEPNSTPRRSSVVDMWRKRESEIARRAKSDPSKPQNKPVQKKIQVPTTTTTSPTLNNTPKSRQIATSSTSPFHNSERERIFNFEEKKEACHDEDQHWNEASANPKPSFAAHARTHEMQSHSGLQIRTTFPHGKASPDPSDHQKQRNDAVASPAAKTLPPLPTPTPSPAAANTTCIQPENKVAESQAVENQLGNSRLNDGVTSHTGPAEVNDESPSKRISRSKVRDMWLQREASNREMPSPMSMPQTPRSSSGRVIPSPSSKTTRKVTNSKYIPSSPSSTMSANRNSLSNSSVGALSPASQSAPQTPRGRVADRWNSKGQNQAVESPSSFTEGSRSIVVDSSPVNSNSESNRRNSLSEAGGEPESPQFNALKARWAKFGANKVHAREGSTCRVDTRRGGEEQVPEPSSVVVSQATTSTERSVRDDKQNRVQEQKKDELRLDIPETLETTPHFSPRISQPPPVETNAIKETNSSPHQNEKSDSNSTSVRKTPSRRQMLLRRRGRSGKQQSEVEPASSMLSMDGSDLGSIKCGDSHSLSTGRTSLDGALGFESAEGREVGPVKMKKDFVKMGQKHAARPKPAGHEALFVWPGGSNQSEEWPFVPSPSEDRSKNSWPAQQAQPGRHSTEQQHTDSQGTGSISGQKMHGHEEMKPSKQHQARQPLDKKKYLNRLANRATLNIHDENSETSDAPSDALSQAFEDAVPADDYRILSEQLTAPKNTSFRKAGDNTSSAIPIQALLACGSTEEEVFGTPFYGGAKSNGSTEVATSSRVLDPSNNPKTSPQNVSNKVKMQPYERMLIHDVLSSDGSSDIASYEGEDITVSTGVSSLSGGARQSTSLASRAGRHLRERRLKKASPANCDIVNENEAVVNPVTRKGSITGQNERYIYPTDDKGTLSAGDKNLFGPGLIVPQQTDSLDEAARILIDSSDPLDIDFGAHHFHSEPSFNPGKQVITPSDQGFPPTGTSRRSPIHSSNVARSPNFGSNVAPFNTMMGPGEEKKMESSSVTSRNSSSGRLSRKTASEHQKKGKEAGASAKSFTNAYQNIGQMAKDFTNDAETLLKANGLNFEKIASDFTEIAQDINVGANIDAVSQSLNKGVSAASQSLNQGMTAASHSLNEGVTVASKSLNQFLATKDGVRTPQKAAERLPSPVEEEIAIEVEYIEDYSDSSEAR